MPEHIKTEHMERMFPFEFFHEISEHLTGYTLANPAFLAQIKEPLTEEQRREIFAKSKTEAALLAVNRNNIMEVEPFGELLHLELCTETIHAEKLVGTAEQRAQVPLSILVGQLYDSSGQPVFAKDVTEDTIKQIPEVLYDDPNLLLAIIQFNENETTVALLQMPEFLEKKMFEPVDDDPDSSK